MAKRKKTYRSEKDNSGNHFVFVVIVLVIIMGLGTVFALGGGNLGGSVNTTGGQSASSLESQVDALTQQANANPKDANVHEQLGTALFNLASSYKQSGDPRTNDTLARTIKVYNETLQLEPNSKETLGDLATAYFYSNQVDQAIFTVEKALKIDPSFVPALLNYGIYLADGKGDSVNAIKQWEKVPAGSEQYSQAKDLIEKYKQQASASPIK